jgi:PPM family protein phosphatase
MTGLLTTVSLSPPGQRPRDEELDLFGLTHQGKVRQENQDHFLVCTVHQQVVIHGTSLPGAERLPLRGQRLATILLVADGVGGGTAGGEASQLATEAVTRYLASTMRCFHVSGASEEKELFESLRTAAFDAHAAVKAESEARSANLPMATTLTIAFAVWPRLYVVQVGDSRCYFYWDGVLRQVTRDQTVAQDLVDAGVLRAEDVGRSPLNNVLARAIGAGEATPDVTMLDISPRGCVVLLCSDGLTKHVSDAEIAEQLRTMTSAEQACRGLLDLALARGGTDNVTVLIGRARREAGPGGA